MGKISRYLDLHILSQVTSLHKVLFIFFLSLILSGYSLYLGYIFYQKTKDLRKVSSSYYKILSENSSFSSSKNHNTDEIISLLSQKLSMTSCCFLKQTLISSDNEKFVSYKITSPYAISNNQLDFLIAQLENTKVGNELPLYDKNFIIRKISWKDCQGNLTLTDLYFFSTP